jgi:FlaA1/EpsC-like NDP-sugar epimerase
MYKRGIKNISLLGDFLYLLFFISLSITILLIVLSLRVAKENNVWTYIEEPRYFGLSVVLLQLAAFIAWQNYYKKQSRILKYVFYTVVLLLLTEMIHGVYFNAKRLINYNKEVYGWQHDFRFQQFAQEIIQKEQQKKPIENIVLACSSPYMNNRISLYSHIPVLKEIDKINNLSSLNTKTSVLLLVVLREDALKDFAPFLSLKEKEDAGHFAGFYFYTVYVEPH